MVNLEIYDDEDDDVFTERQLRDRERASAEETLNTFYEWNDDPNATLETIVKETGIRQELLAEILSEK